MSDSTLIIPSAVATAMATETARLGAPPVETAGFLLTPAEDLTVTVVAFTGTTVITRHCNIPQVSTRAPARLFDYTDNKIV